jgi:hypothetical protein
MGKASVNLFPDFSSWPGKGIRVWGKQDGIGKKKLHEGSGRRTRY